MPLNGLEQTIPIGHSLAPAQHTPLNSNRSVQIPHTTQHQQTLDRQPLSTLPAANAQTPARRFTRQDYDVATIDQFDGPKTVVKPHPSSQPANVRKNTPAHSRPRTSNANPTRVASKEDLKVPVADTMVTNQSAPAMKHQTSQTTEGSVHDGPSTLNGGSRQQNRILQSNVRFADIQNHNTSSYPQDQSSLFDSARYDDYGDGQPDLENEERTVFFRPTANDHIHQQPRTDPQRGQGGQLSTVAGQSKDKNKHKLQKSQNLQRPYETDVGFNQPNYMQQEQDDYQKGYEHNDYDGRDDDSQSALFNQIDLQEQGRRDLYDATPSKPGAIPGSKARTIATTKQRSAARQEPRDPGRGSSPLGEVPWYAPATADAIPVHAIATTDTNLPVYKGYAMQQVEEDRKERSAQQEVSTKIPAQTAAKVGASVEVSEDELPVVPSRPQTSTNKRSFDQLDYEREHLYQMEYSALDEVDFMVDPRHPLQPSAVDEHGAVITLEQKLEKLGNMNSEGQKALFLSLSDTEGEDVGHWFMETLADDLKSMMQKRLERRQVSLKYELEVKKRQKAVETKFTDIEHELKELKQGGGDLLQGRASPRPSRAEQ